MRNFRVPFSRLGNLPLRTIVIVSLLGCQNNHEMDGVISAESPPRLGQSRDQASESRNRKEGPNSQDGDMQSRSLSPAERHAVEAKRLAALNKIDDALEEYQQALEIEPQNEKYWNERFFLLQSAGRYGEIKSDALKCLELNVSSKGAIYYRLAFAHLVLRESHDALAACDAGLQVDDTDEGLYKLRGDANRQLEEYEQAYADYSRALTQWNHLLLVKRCEVAIKLGHFDDALIDAESAMRSPHAVPAAMMAIILASRPEDEKRNGRESLHWAQVAKKLMSESDRYLVYTALAAAHAECGDFEAAVTNQRAAMKTPRELDWAEAKMRLQCYEMQKPFRFLPSIKAGTTS